MQQELDNRGQFTPASALNRERVSQALLMSRKRAMGRDLVIPSCRNPRRRRRCLKDPALFLQTYKPEIFYNPFSDNQREMITAFEDRLTYGGWEATSGERGVGKTNIALGLTVKAIAKRLARYVAFVSANGKDAGQRQQDLMAWFEKDGPFPEDFPEICYPIRALEGANQRARLQTVEGVRTRLQWTGDFLVFPTVPGSLASGAIVTCRGIDSAITGMVYQGMRPDLAVIDDCETRDTATSPVSIEKNESTIEADIVGLAGPQKNLAILYLCTIRAGGCLADRFTDPKIKPAWHGRRLCLLKQKPAREEMWGKYMDLRQRGQLAGDEYAREAFRFYKENRRAMDEGAILTNPYRFDSKLCPDGTPLQISALQFCYDMVSDIGWTKFDSEFQSKPPADEAPEKLDIDVGMVQTKIDGRPRGTVPHDADYLTAAADLHARHIEWVVFAWKAGRGYCVDYGVEEVHSPLSGSLKDPSQIQAVQDAILTALCELRDKFADGWPDESTGEVRYLKYCLIDTGYMDTPVWEFLAATGGGVYRASKGEGSSRGQVRYRAPAKKGMGRRGGEHWYASRLPKEKKWLYHLDADYWKKFVHSGFQTPKDAHGCLTLFGSDPVVHRYYAQHITAEEWTCEYETGKGRREYWKPVRRDNHWLDCTSMACAAAAMCGMKTVARPASETTPAVKGAKASPTSAAENKPSSQKEPSGPSRVAPDTDNQTPARHRVGGRCFSRMARFAH